MKQHTHSDFGRYLTLVLAIVVIVGVLSVAVPAMVQSLAEAQTTACQQVFTQPGDCQ